MSGITTDDGIEWLSRRAAGEESDNVVAVAVGDGTSNPSASDSSMESELHRESSTFEHLSSGQTEYSIEITGGTEVAAGSQITEFGLFTNTTSGDGTLVYHESRDPVTIHQGATTEFIVPFEVSR